MSRFLTATRGPERHLAHAKVTIHLAVVPLRQERRIITGIDLLQHVCLLSAYLQSVFGIDLQEIQVSFGLNQHARHLSARPQSVPQRDHLVFQAICDDIRVGPNQRAYPLGVCLSMSFHQTVYILVTRARKSTGMRL